MDGGWMTERDEAPSDVRLPYCARDLALSAERSGERYPVTSDHDNLRNSFGEFETGQEPMPQEGFHFLLASRP